MLSQNQKAILERVRALGGGSQGIALSDEQCVGLIAVVVRDLGLGDSFPQLPLVTGSFFDIIPESLHVPSIDLFNVYEKLLVLNRDADTYFQCLATLHKSRLKYRRILSTQPFPSFDQVGPRGLRQFGMLPSSELSALLSWRKWMFDIDNRAGQETGYLFEPIIANSIGGVSVGARHSPIRRRRLPSQGRQVDCIKDRLAYEIKLRVTIAASGQGRWQEELDFPQDARESGFRPVLIVLDPTTNPKLSELSDAFVASDGIVYAGDAAWEHLEREAGSTMGSFLDNYVRFPLATMLQSTPAQIPDLTLSMQADAVVFKVGAVEHSVPRQSKVATDADESL